MGKPHTNLCKQALQEGQTTCKGEDLLTECIDISKKLEIACVTKGEQKEAEVKLKIKKALWREPQCNYSFFSLGGGGEDIQSIPHFPLSLD